MAQLRTVSVTHDAGCKVAHNLLSHRFTFKQGSYYVEQALDILLLMILDPRCDSFILALGFGLTHFMREPISSPLESVIGFESQRVGHNTNGKEGAENRTVFEEVASARPDSLLKVDAARSGDPSDTCISILHKYLLHLI